MRKPRPNQLSGSRVWSFLVSCLIFVNFPTFALALTVSPAYETNQDLNYVPSASLEFGERVYDANVTFRGERRQELTGSHLVATFRNDFNLHRRITFGLNMNIGRLDNGSLTADTYSHSLQGSVGLGGGFRFSVLLLDDFLGVDWFTDFQAFSIASDPPRSQLNREDWHIALGVQQQYQNLVVEGGTLLSGTKFDMKGTSTGDTIVDLSANESNRYGLFLNTRYPITNRIQGLAEVVFTEGVSVNLGANYRFKVMDFVPEVGRKRVDGARQLPPEQRELSTEEFLARAQEAIDNENFGPALDWLNKALETNPTEADLYYQIARSYYLIGESKRAEKYIAYATRQKSNSAEFNFLYGIILESMGQFDKSASYYRRALNSDPTHQRALYKLNALEDK